MCVSGHIGEYMSAIEYCLRATSHRLDYAADFVEKIHEDGGLQVTDYYTQEVGLVPSSGLRRYENQDVEG